MQGLQDVSVTVEERQESYLLLGCGCIEFFAIKSVWRTLCARQSKSSRRLTLFLIEDKLTYPDRSSILESLGKLTKTRRQLNNEVRKDLSKDIAPRRCFLLVSAAF